MAILTYVAIASLDGYVEDEEGRFDWAAPDDEVHAFVNDLERPIGTYLYGRRMYETMATWDDPDFVSGARPVVLDFAQLWRAAEKVVFSRTLPGATTARTRIQRSFDPEVIRRMKADADRDITVG